MRQSSFLVLCQGLGWDFLRQEFMQDFGNLCGIPEIFLFEMESGYDKIKDIENHVFMR